MQMLFPECFLDKCFSPLFNLFIEEPFADDKNAQ